MWMEVDLCLYFDMVCNGIVFFDVIGKIVCKVFNDIGFILYYFLVVFYFMFGKVFIVVVEMFFSSYVVLMFINFLMNFCCDVMKFYCGCFVNLVYLEIDLSWVSFYSCF